LKLKDLLTKPAVEAAPLLLGCILCRQTKDGILKLRIVETEAYHQADPASHSYKWKTVRTAPMFEAGGTIYVYFTYGMHYAINIVTGEKGVGEAVLLRAAEPIEGIGIMKRNRQADNLRNIASGPGKLTQALGIRSTELSGKKLGKSTLWLELPTEKIATKDIIASPRIGISQAKDQPWRFYIKDSPYVSR
jgi:DNA-3-methyladenine glycosylase